MSRVNKERWTNCTAVYVRMSTEHQQYSTSNQMDVIREYAKRRQLGIVKEYSDEGKRGLNIQGRDSLAQMIRDVQDLHAENGVRRSNVIEQHSTGFAIALGVLRVIQNVGGVRLLKIAQFG